MTDVQIGVAAERSGVKVPTIRYYEEVGLLPAPQRGNNQRRRYTDSDMRRLSFIRHARELGFKVEAIRTLLGMQDDPQQSCAAADATARERLAEVDEKIARLSALRIELVKMLDSCAVGRVADCKVIETLSQTHQHGRLDE
jgi:DNA-binding transcriptional MerR regulator